MSHPYPVLHTIIVKASQGPWKLSINFVYVFSGKEIDGEFSSTVYRKKLPCAFIRFHFSASQMSLLYERFSIHKNEHGTFFYVCVCIYGVISYGQFKMWDVRWEIQTRPLPKGLDGLCDATNWTLQFSTGENTQF